MAFSRKKNLFFSFIFLIAWVSTLAFWYEANTWFTEFSYDSTGDIKTLNLTVSGSEQWSFFIYLANKSQETISGRFSFVDAVALEGGAVACLSENEKSNVWQYLSAANTGFTLTWWETLVKEITYKFPSNWSWSYYGCVTYIPDGIEDSNANPIPRKALILNVILNPEEVQLYMVVNFWSRGWSDLMGVHTSNRNWYESKWKILFYDIWNRERPRFSWYVVIDSEWYGILSWLNVIAGCYDVVYKWWQHLSSYIPNLCVVQSWEVINFTTWNVIWTEQFAVDSPYNSWLEYQVAWDLPKLADGKYDFVINTLDLTMLRSTDYCKYGEKVSKPFICDFNNDWKVNSNDDTVILSHLPQLQDDVYYLSNYFDEEWFGSVPYWHENDN